jgi:hypothetical protein
MDFSQIVIMSADFSAIHNHAHRISVCQGFLRWSNLMLTLFHQILSLAISQHGHFQLPPRMFPYGEEVCKYGKMFRSAVAGLIFLPSMVSLP